MPEADATPPPDPDRVREVFDRARALTGLGRAAYLADACGADRGLQREVEELLRYLGDISTTFGGEETSGRPSAFGTDREHLAPGTVVGAYTIEGILGQGGMGAVYLARQERPQRTVALKLIRGGWAGEHTRRRFKRETELLGRLQHPGIAQIYEAGIAETPNGTQPYFAMELVRGRTLLEHAADAGLDTRARLRLLARICDAADHAHRQGIIHRDLKPANILVTKDGQPKILDFGIARATDSDLQITTVQTDIGQLIGTVPYMSPEQASGDVEALDARSDVYALGIIAYQLLAGRLPYDLSGKMIHEAVRIIHDDDPTPLSSLDRSLRGDVETIVAKALEKERDRRYSSASDLGSDIERYLQSKPITARPPSTVYQLRKFARRNKALVAGVVATFVVLIAGIAGTSWQAIRATHANASMRTAAAQATAVNQFLTDMLEQADPWQVPGRTTVEDAVLRAASLVDERFEGQPAVELSVRETIGDTLRGLGSFSQAIPQYDAAIALSQQTLGPDDEKTLALRVSRAVALLHAGRLGEAEPAFAQILLEADRFGPAHAQMLRARLGLADTVTDLGEDPDRAIKLHTEVADAYEQARGHDDPGTLTAQSSLAATYLYFQRIDEARALYEDLLERHLRIFGPDHPKTIAIRSSLARTFEVRGDYAAAEALLKANVAIAPDALGPDHPETAAAFSGLANVLQSTGRAQEAEPYYLRCVEIARARLGEEHPYTQVHVNNYAGCLAREGKFDEALALHRKNLEVRRRTLGEDHPDTAQSLAFIGTTLMRAGRNDEAEEYLRQAIEIYRKAYDYEDAPDIIDNTMNLGVAHLRQGEFAEAVPCLLTVVESERRTLPADHQWIAIDGARLASALDGAGEYERALVEWDEAIRINAKNQPENAAKGADLSSRRATTLVHLGRFAEAEPILVGANDVLSADERTAQWRDENIQRLVDLYAAWDVAEPGAGHAARAETWRAKLPASPEGSDGKAPGS